MRSERTHEGCTRHRELVLWTISREELQQVLSDLGETLRNEDVESIIKEVDTNEDGKLDYNGEDNYCARSEI